MSPYIDPAERTIDTHLRLTRPALSIPEKLAYYSMPNNYGCRVWVGARNAGGYGCLWLPEKKRLAYVHRVCYSLMAGRELARHEHVLHICDNRACIATSHLRIGSNRLNICDKMAKGRAAKRLTRAQVLEIFYKSWLEEANQMELAAEYGVSPSTVSSIHTGRTWGWLTGMGDPVQTIAEQDPDVEILGYLRIT